MLMLLRPNYEILAMLFRPNNDEIYTYIRYPLLANNNIASNLSPNVDFRCVHVWTHCVSNMNIILSFIFKITVNNSRNFLGDTKFSSCSCWKLMDGWISLMDEVFDVYICEDCRWNTKYPPPPLFTLAFAPASSHEHITSTNKLAASLQTIF